MPELAVGDKLPESIVLKYTDGEGNMKDITVGELTAGKKVVFFSVPGAYTPTCSRKHLPGFLDRADDIKAKGIDTIVCIAVNDAFVMQAWGQSLGVGSKVLMVADGNAEFAKATGTDVDLGEFGLGLRSKRYALLVEDGEVKAYAPEPGAGLTCSSADAVLAILP